MSAPEAKSVTDPPSDAAAVVVDRVSILHSISKSPFVHGWTRQIRSIECENCRIPRLDNSDSMKRPRPSAIEA